MKLGYKYLYNYLCGNFFFTAECIYYYLWAWVCVLPLTVPKCVRINYALAQFECKHLYSHPTSVSKSLRQWEYKTPWTVASAYGQSHAHIGLSLQIDGNEIFLNLNVNGSEIYWWVLCNYHCHNLLYLCLCKVESKKRRIWETEKRNWSGGENKEKKFEGLWKAYQNDRKRKGNDLYLGMVSCLSKVGVDSCLSERE